MSEGRDRRNPDDRGHRGRKPRGRKDTKRWCRGKVGVEHVPEITLPKFVLSYRSEPYCRPAPEWAKALYRYWWCDHRETCANCGKVLRYMIREDECPVLRAASGDADTAGNLPGVSGHHEGGAR